MILLKKLNYMEMVKKMITSRKELKEILKYEKKLYIKKSLLGKIGQYISGSYEPKIYKYIVYMRKAEYYYNTNKKIVSKLGYCYYKRKKMNLGLKLGIHIGNNAFDKGLRIYHPFDIIVNGKARIGKNCEIRGNLCIGNDGFNEANCPIIGDNVSIGYGVTIIGKIEISNNTIIGANSLVNKSFKKENITIVGNPCREIKKKKVGEGENE